MSITRPFAYNIGSPISGTTQVGSLAVGDINIEYSANYGGVIWWEGPDETLGYVIAESVSGNTQPTEIPGVYASVGFYRSEFLTEPSFIGIAGYVSQGQTFDTGNQAATWLTNNGYWSSWIYTTPTPTPTNTVTPTVTPTTTETPTQTPTPTNTETPTQTPTNTETPTQTPTPTNTMTPTNTETPTQTPTPTNTETTTQTPTTTTTLTSTPTQTPTPTTTTTLTSTPTNTSTPTTTTTLTSTPTPTRTGTPTPTNINAQGFSYSNFASTAGLTLVGAAAVSGGTIIALTTTSSASVGNMYRTTAIQYNRNFSSQWSTFIGGGTGADGYCVQWTTTNNTNGTSGGGVGRIEASSTINAIGFYTFTNNNIQWYKSNILQSTTSVSAGFWRQQLYFWADYNNSAQTLALYYNTTNSKPGSPNQTFTSFSFDTGYYYMGFGAAIGGSNDNQEILSWSLQFT